jgi:hypothetical protein
MMRFLEIDSPILRGKYRSAAKFLVGESYGNIRRKLAGSEPEDLSAIRF